MESGGMGGDGRLSARAAKIGSDEAIRYGLERFSLRSTTNRK